MQALRILGIIMALSSASIADAKDWLGLAERQDIELADFEFHTGEVLPSVTMSVYTLGTPRRDENGKVTNAVMLLHGTGGSGRSLLRDIFGDELFGPGQLLDIEKHYIISPDNLGHGDSSKPSDGMLTDFPRYDYEDMVLAQKRMLTEGLKVDQLSLIIGTSMGCMHSFVWGISHPDFVRRFVPLACNAIEIAGRNRMMRKMVIDGFKEDPAYQGGKYENPADLRMGQVIRLYTLSLAGPNPYRMQAEYPTRVQAEDALDERVERAMNNPVDPTDTIYQFDSSRDYNPAPRLAEIQVPVLWINSADDFINPPGLGNPEALAARMPNARFVLIPASAETRGHGTHTAASFWKDDLASFLAQNP
ncbi:MAG: alpha/beta fold hydrolase [Halieaceae bacterium]|nr:alpha/beta fold hydrolase [Halieaceae bacterium]